MTISDGSITLPKTPAGDERGVRSHPLIELAYRLQKLSFPLFILLNAVLFIRPSEDFETLRKWPIYEFLFIGCLLASAAPMIRRFSFQSLLENPISLCVLGLVPAAVLSQLSHRRLVPAAGSGLEMTKLALYYFLLVSIIDTPLKLRQFLGWIAAFACVQIGMAVLQNHNVINLPAFQPVAEQEFRTRGTGIFQDPNDLGVLASMTACLCLYQLRLCVVAKNRIRWVPAALWIFAAMIAVYGLILTKSRGGYVALVAGLGAFGLTRFGWKKCLIVAVILIPLMRLTLGGRQTDINVRRTTAQSRMEFWKKGLTLFSQSPVFGIGQERFKSVVGNVAHNSFIHCFTELGFFGGALFLGSFCLAIWLIFMTRDDPKNTNDPTADSYLFQMRPYVLAMIVAWAAGMMTLSRSYEPPTYMTLGIATAYLSLLAQKQSLPRLRFTGKLAIQLVGVSVAFLAGMYLFVRVFHHGA